MKKTYQQYYADIAQAIRNKGGSGYFTPAQMPEAIKGLQVSGIGTVTTFPSSGGYNRDAMTDPANYTAIAAAIRAKAGTTDKYTPSQMAAVIQALCARIVVKFSNPSGLSNIYAVNAATGATVQYSSSVGGIPITAGTWRIYATRSYGTVGGTITVTEADAGDYYVNY